MKILTINSHDNSGGAARAAYNSHKGLIEIGIESKMLVAQKGTSDHTVIGPDSNLHKLQSILAMRIDSLPGKLHTTPNKNLHSPAWFSTFKNADIAKYNPDIIHLHWVNGGFLSIKDISKIKKPIVWTLHDMWPFSGAEHYSDGSMRYRDGYRSENRMNDESGFDLNRWVWNRKVKYWHEIDNITFAAPCKWMAESIRESKLFHDRRVEIVPVGLDHTLYRPRDKKTIRNILDMPLDKKIILIGAMNFLKDTRKGGHFLKEAFGSLVRAGYGDDYVVYILGISAPEKEESFGFKTFYYGANRDDLSLALLYSAVDVFVAPSVQENFSATVFESLSCGTPVVAFNIGGMPDMISHKQNGYLAEPYETEDLASGIEWVLEKSSPTQLSQNARQFIENECTLRIQAERYKNIYESMGS